MWCIDMERGHLVGGMERGRLAGGMERGRLAGCMERGRLAGGMERGRLAGCMERGRLVGGMERGRLARGMERGRLARSYLLAATIITAILLSSICSAWSRPHPSPEYGVKSKKGLKEAGTIRMESHFFRGALQIPLLKDAPLAQKPQTAEIYQLDSSPVGDRKVLLFVHGGGGEHKPAFRWDRVLDSFSQDADFETSYKVLFLRYDSTDALDDEISSSKEALQNLSRTIRRPIIVVALSMGGNLIQGVLSDESVEHGIEKAICMGTPFHGSPLFSASWFQYSLSRYKARPITRLVNSLDYKAYFHLHPNYQRDLQWDNMDEAIPEIGSFHSLTRQGPRGALSIAGDKQPPLARTNRKGTVDKAKIIAYAGYLLSDDVLESDKRHPVGARLLAPYRFLTVRVPAQLGREQAALKVLNREIAKIATADSGKRLSNQYALNDGITPIASALYLPPEVERTYPLAHEDQILGLREKLDIRLGRVFRNIDHITYIEGVPPHRGSPMVVDMLHPEDGKRLIFDWLLDELLERDQAYRKDDELMTSN